MAVKEVERKITKIGNSVGVTIPQEVLNHLKVKQGDDVKFILEKDGSVSIKKPVNMDFLDQEFLEGLEDLFENYDDTLRNLSDR